ncbi:F-box only protein 28-like [Anneissia japonica]|uniref:F-box only protein 28-like n=1 Tax=Anneissia japonica TaxID=1529436 RepID=UPI0014256F3B|nr:F-box only protein 28-like [Anneissia japonica]
MDPSVRSSRVEPSTSLSYETNETDDSKVLEQPTLLSLPTEVVEMILSNCSYAEISEKRLVCKFFNQVCQSVLNQGLHQVMRYHNQCSRKLKALLPRRESERRNHALARHCDILSAIETRMSLLSMTYSKYIDLRLCCFIPGKVIDEVYYVLRYLQSTESPPRAHELLQELRDISSMAMEHFDEKIVPGLKKSLLPRETPSQSYSSAGVRMAGDLTDPSDICQDRYQQAFHKLQAKQRYTLTSIVTLKKDLQSCKSQLAEERRKVEEQGRTVAQQGLLIAELSTANGVLERKLLEQQSKQVQYDQMFEDLSAKVAMLDERTGDDKEGPSRKRAHRDVPATSAKSDLFAKKARKK